MMKVKKSKRNLISLLLTVAMLFGLSATVFASDTTTDPLEGLVLAGSYTETHEDYSIEKKLYVNSEQFTRGFGGNLNATVVHDINNNTGSTSLRVVGNATFKCTSGTDGIEYVYVANNNYNLYAYTTHWYFMNNSDAVTGSGSYATYNVYYTYQGSTKTYSDTAFITCGPNGDVSDNSGPKSAVMPNQVVVGDAVLTF